MYNHSLGDDFSSNISKSFSKGFLQFANHQVVPILAGFCYAVFRGVNHILVLFLVPKSPNLPHPGDCGGLRPLSWDLRDGHVPSHPRGLQCGGPSSHGDYRPALRPLQGCGRGVSVAWGGAAPWLAHGGGEGMH